MYPNETGYFTYGVLNSGWDNHYSIGVPEDYVFTSSNPSVIEVDSYGKFKSKKDGTATLKVAMKDYPELFCTYDITVKSEYWDPDQLSVSVSREWAYTGSPITPKPSFVLYGEYEILDEGEDYTVSYKNNVNPGTASMIITGCRKYKGTKIINFTITPPNPMQNIKIESAGTSVFITSDPVKDATGYEFYIDMGGWGLSMINAVPECEFDDLEPSK